MASHNWNKFSKYFT